MRTVHVAAALVVLSLSSIVFANSDDDKLQDIFETFTAEYPDLKVPELNLSYVENFKNIQDLDGIERQRDLFVSTRNQLHTIRRQGLSSEYQYQYDTLVYEVNLNLRRLALETRFKEHDDGSPVPSTGLHSIRDGKEWYSWYVKRWTAAGLSPDQLFTFGMDEVKRVQSEIKKIQKSAGYEGRDQEFYKFLNGPNFFITNQNELVSTLKDLRDQIQKNLSYDFAITDIPVVDIKPIPNPTKDTPPGYYDDGAFYFNFYGNSFRKRTLEWLFIHEANPGHHYQNIISDRSTNRPSFAKFFWYPGFTEGWGAYSEDIGKDLGMYGDIYQYLGKWEWDLVRSARIVLDVGLNYMGWNRDQAMKFWKENIMNQDDIAVREIDRMIRWPAQVLSYKVGEHC